MLSPLLDRSLADLACTLPGATALFHRHRLDFCCGGQRSLRAAAQSRSLDPEGLTLELEALQGTPGETTDWRAAAPATLIGHIVSHFHERLHWQLPELVRLARRVEHVHAARPECPHGVADLLEELQQELTSHMQKEEQVLFPLLLQGNLPWAQGPIGAMRMEHEQHHDALERMAVLAHGLVLPQGACNTWRALILGLQTLYLELTEHIHLENNVLFDQAQPVATGCGGGCACSCSAA